MSDRINVLLSQLTLEEKVALLAGSDMWHTTPIPRLGIPALKVTDGPNGARGGAFFGGVTAACFPVGSALGASWNSDLVEQVGAAIAEEAQTKGARIVLAPTVNLHRTPLAGRNFECYSEDPYLTGVLAAAYIRGVQGRNVGATIKHYACNDQEFERNTISSEVTERPLRELYLRPFQIAIGESKPWCVMSSYNKLNGVYASENPYLLTDILRGEWGFDGLVMSDWFGTKSSGASVAAGQDLEMPGPTAWRGAKILQEIEAGELDIAAVDACARRVLELLERAGCFDDPTEPAESAVDRPEHRALIRRAGAEAAVLLKNKDSVLPVNPGEVRRVAVIGPNAATARIMGGGSARVNAHRRITPLAGIQALADGRFDVSYELGCTNDRSLPLIPPDWMVGGQLTASYFNSLDLTGSVVARQPVTSTEQLWLGAFLEGLDPKRFSMRLEGTITAPETGSYQFGLITGGKSRLRLDGTLVLDNWLAQKTSENYFGMAGEEIVVEVPLEKGRKVAVEVEYSSEGVSGLAVNRLGCRAPLPGDAIERAAELAAASDVALVFVGLSDEWDSEGFDRQDMELPGEQNALVAAVAAANPHTVVVLNVGGPVTMPWLDDVAAVLLMWYPGQELGHAAADVLFGLAEPSGRLPQTWPVRLEDNPAYLNYPGENGKVHYGEGLFIGYRYYDAKRIAPRFPFGFGLGYTDFAFGPLRLSATEMAPDGQLTATVEVTNTGTRTGAAVVQLYVHDVASRLVRPEKALNGFARARLEPGQTATVRFTIGRDALAYYDDAPMAWVAEAGDFVVLVGASAADIRSQATFRLTATQQFGGKTHQKKSYDLNTPLGVLLDDPDAVAVLAKHLPDLVGMAGSPQASMARGFSLTMIRGFMPNLLSDEQLTGIQKDLAEL